MLNIKPLNHTSTLIFLKSTRNLKVLLSKIETFVTPPLPPKRNSNSSKTKTDRTRSFKKVIFSARNRPSYAFSRHYRCRFSVRNTKECFCILNHCSVGNKTKQINK